MKVVIEYAFTMCLTSEFLFFKETFSRIPCDMTDNPITLS